MYEAVNRGLYKLYTGGSVGCFGLTRPLHWSPGWKTRYETVYNVGPFKEPRLLYDGSGCWLVAPVLEPSDMLLVSTLVFMGMGPVLLWDEMRLAPAPALAEAPPPLSRRFTSSSSVPAQRSWHQAAERVPGPNHQLMFTVQTCTAVPTHNWP